MKTKIKFYRRKLEIPTYSGEVARYYSDLMYVKYEDPYSKLYFSNGEKYKAEVPLQYLMKNLPPKPFFQCNRSTIINICYYAEIRENPPRIIMDDGTELSLSVRNIAKFKHHKAGLKRISPQCHPSSDSKNESCPDFGMFCLPLD